MKPDPVVVLDRVFELAEQVGGLMSATLTERGLTPARAEALLVLHHHGVPMVQRQLSLALRCTPRHVTALVDALEGLGMVRRAPHPTDRRATLVSLTGTGSAAAGQMATERRDSAAGLLAGIPDAALDGFLLVADHVLRNLGFAVSPPVPVPPVPPPR